MMRKIPMPSGYRKAFKALWLNRTAGHELYGHLQWKDGQAWSFNEKRGIAITIKPAKRVFCEMMGDEEMLFDADCQDHELHGVEGDDHFDYEYINTVTFGGAVLATYRFRDEEAVEDNMRALREVTGGYVSLKQLASMKWIPFSGAIVKENGLVLFGNFARVWIRHRSVQRPKVRKGYEQYLERVEDF